MDESEYRDEEKRLGWVITKVPERDRSSLPHGVLFMVDRHRIRTKWWTKYLSEAKNWNSEIGATKIANGLKFGDVSVKSRIDFHK